MVFCLFFTPLVFYLPIFYTDTITLPFIVIPLYYLSNYFFENEKEYYIIISGLLFGIGGVIKPTVLIPFIAIILYAICSKKNAFIWKLVGVVIIPLLGYKVFVHHFFVQEYFENARIPKNHYIMIGLEKDGGFSQEAYEYTIQYSGEQARKEADNKRIQERIKEMIQKHQVIPFYNRKMSYTWTDGTFFAYEKLRRDPYHPENTKYILSTKEDHWYWLMANAEWIIILCLMIMGTIFRNHLPKKLRDMQWILNTSIIGLFLFLLLWETRSRYLVNFSPIFLLNAYIGLIAMKEKWNDKEKAK
jgi:4-amino-4-deoxy-L-arabinose transferase-like glycosyltransferase